MDKKTIKALTLGLTLVAVGLSYWLLRIINQPIEFEKIKSDRYAAIIERLEQIREVQQAHLQENGKYAADFDALIAFVDTGAITLIERKDSSFMYYDKIYQQDMNKDTVIERVLGTQRVKENLFDSEFDAAQLRFIPLPGDLKGTEEFNIGASSIERNGLRIPVFEVGAPNTVIFQDLPGDFSIFVDRDYSLKIGSLTEPKVTGNWK